MKSRTAILSFLCRILMAAVACGWGTGCAMLETSKASASSPGAQGTPLSWLTSWVSQPIEMAAGFDAEEIHPAPVPPVVAPGNLLEVTVWDLYEIGKPYSFPVRVSDAFRIDVPMLGEVFVENRTIGQVEAALVDGFRQGEYLLNPRVLVRSLDAPVLKVQVTGAVNRPGYVELTRGDRSVYAAIQSAGGLSKLAGTQVAVTRAAISSMPEIHPEPAIGRASHEAEPLPADGDGSGDFETSPEPSAPIQRANSVEDLSVSPAPPLVRPAPRARGLYSVLDTDTDAAGVAHVGRSNPVQRAPLAPSRQPRSASSRPIAAAAPESVSVWYDVSVPRDRDRLRGVLLAEGDTVLVKPAVQPLRIGGLVNQPGAYPLPAGRTLNAWQAIELAGGVRDGNVPLKITLLRPASEGRGAWRWAINVASYDQQPTDADSPSLEPGDELQVVPTTASKFKRAVRDVWSKP